jgi:hypothetical protein
MLLTYSQTSMSGNLNIKPPNMLSTAGGNSFLYGSTPLIYFFLSLVIGSGKSIPIVNGDHTTTSASFYLKTLGFI